MIYDETSDVGTTYLGNVFCQRNTDFILEESFSCDPLAWTNACLPDGTEVTLQIDTGVTKCIMSKGFYDAYPVLHDLPKYKSYTTALEVGDGRHIPVLFVIPLVLTFEKHHFKIFMLVHNSEKNKLLLLGMKNVVEIEGVICTRTLQMKFLNRSAPMFPTVDTLVKPAEKRTIKLNIAFPCELSGIAPVKLFTHLQYPCALRLNVICNNSAIEIENCQNVDLIFHRNDPIGIIDARSLGYYHVPHEAISTAITPRYRLVTANHVQLAMNKMATDM